MVEVVISVPLGIVEVRYRIINDRYVLFHNRCILWTKMHWYPHMQTNGKSAVYPKLR